MLRKRTSLRWYFSCLRHLRWSAALLIGVGVLGVLLNLSRPLLIKILIDEAIIAPGILIQERLANLLGFIGLLIAVTIGMQLTEVFQSYHSTKLDVSVVLRFRKMLFNKLIHCPISKLSELKTGGIISRLSRDVDSISGLFSSLILSPTVLIIQTILGLSIAFALEWRLAAVVVVLIPMALWLHSWWVFKVRSIYREIRRELGFIDATTSEIFAGVRVIKTYCREKSEESRFVRSQKNIIRKYLHAKRLELLPAAAWGLKIPLVTIIVLGVGGYFVITEQVTFGEIMGIQWLALIIFEPTRGIANEISQTQRGLSALDRVVEVLQFEDDMPDGPDTRDAPSPIHEIKFDNVYFHHRPDQPVIENVNLEIPSGKLLAVVGPSGAGKTTLVDLLLRFYDPTSGGIFINGANIRQIKLRSYRNLFGIVQQDVFLFDGTIRDNIAFAEPEATHEQIINAARQANALNFINEMPDGFDTRIGERGTRLSGGERQRISIARAFLADRKILILDEPTSNLDSESETQVRIALDQLIKDRTTIVVAHRLSTIVSADLIVVLENGHVTEIGTHKQLIERRGRYWSMAYGQRLVDSSET